MILNFIKSGVPNLFRTIPVLFMIFGTAVSATAVSSTTESVAPSLVDVQIDSVKQTSKVVSIEGKKLSPEEVDSIYQLITTFYYDQFRHVQDPYSPYFLFMSKGADLTMGIGGVVRMRGWYDWGGAIPVNAFAPALIPIPENPLQERKFGTTPAGTTLFMQMIGRNRVIGDYGLYIEANFNGYEGRGFHLKKAYAMIRNFTVGYANSTFSDPAALAPTVDAQGATNKLAKTNVLVRYMPSWGPWSVGVSAETPDAVIGADGMNTRATSQWLPDFAALVQYQWARGQHVRLAGIIRTLGYRDMILEKNFNKVGWGLQLSSVAHPAYPLTTYLTFNCGNGYGSLCNDLIAVVTDLIPNPEKAGELYAPFAFGYAVGLQYNFRRNIFASAQFSQTRMLPSHEISPDAYKYGYCLNVNCFWNPVERLQVGVEFDWGKRQNFSRQHRFARRVGTMVQFSF